MTKVEVRPNAARGVAFSERAHAVIPGGAHTYSKGDDQFPANAPSCFVRGKGARVWDLEDREFVDWGMGINSVLLGHAEDEVDDAAVAALRGGQNFSRPTAREVDAAEALVDLFPGMEMAKFAKNGSDANTAAVRLARAVTGRTKVAFDATAPFLAIHDWFISTTVMSEGVPPHERDLAVPFVFNDVGSVERAFADHGSDLAAVVLEPCREVAPAPGFLEAIRRLCDAHGTVLVFDEIVTAFRYALHGMYDLLGVRPDLLSIGKGMANGYALSALLGRRPIMERGGIRGAAERVFLLSTTNGAEQSALAASLAVARIYRREDVIGHLYTVGRQVMDALDAAARAAGVAGRVSAASDYTCRPVLRFLDAEGAPSAELRTLFQQELVENGVFMPWICPSFRHGPDELARTRDAFHEACRVYARALERGSVEGLLRGPAAKPVFRRFN